MPISILCQKQLPEAKLAPQTTCGNMEPSVYNNMGADEFFMVLVAVIATQRCVYGGELQLVLPLKGILEKICSS